MRKLSDYSYEDTVKAYSDIGVRQGGTVYVTGNLGMLGLGLGVRKMEVLAKHYRALTSLLGQEGTLVVPTHTYFLCNTETPFDAEKTSGESGIFPEFVRRLPSAVRQFHPFASRTAIGRNGKEICERCSRHAYGPHTPFARLLELDAVFVSFGMFPRTVVSLVHHCEFVMGVPYRYSKEFMHPVVRDGNLAIEPFYCFVSYVECDIERDQNQRIFKHFTDENELRVARLGASRVNGFSMREFFKSTTELLCEDIYAWLARPPTQRPYQR